MIFRDKIPQREGRLLCSPRNPELEAQKWCQSYSFRSFQQNVIIVGLGAGYHVDEFVQRNPSLHVTVLEKDESLIQSFQSSKKYRSSGLHGSPTIIHVIDADEFIKSDIGLDLLLNNDGVFPFKPCWQGAEKFFVQLFLNFNQKHQDSYQKSRAVVDWNSNEESLWKCLREMVK